MPSDAASRSRSRADTLLAILSGALVFAVYLATIYPGLISMGDAAKFAFVGKILGTPHAPGYPLYVLVSHLFSYVPLGSLAYRMNVLSALFGAVTVGLLFATVRTLGGSRAAAASAALGLGFGRAFWSTSQYAKGYTLNAAMVCAGTLMLLRWAQTRRRLHLYWAIAIFAISVGNHLIVISLLPALILFALLTDVRAALAPRTLLVAAALLAVGVSQYSLILVRTWQQAPYLEARASNLRELADVMTARRYAHEVVAYPLAHVVDERLPQVGGLVARELTRPGLLLVAAGVVALALRRRWREAGLCMVGALGVAALTINMSSDEDEGFLLPAFVLLWILAGAGLDGLAAVARRAGVRAGGVPRTLAAAGAFFVAVAIPAAQVAANYRANDHSRRTFEIRYFGALFEMLPDKSALVLDAYSTNMMIRYKLLGEEAAAGRDIVTVLPVPDRVAELRRAGYQIFAFSQGRSELTKFGYEFAPEQLWDLPLAQYLDVVPRGWIVAAAVTPGAIAHARTNRDGWRRLGVPADVFFERQARAYGVIGVAGSGGGGLESSAADDVELLAPGGRPVGATSVVAPGDIHVTASVHGASASISGRELARTSHGAVLVVVAPDGAATAHALDLRRDLRVPFDMRLLPFFRLVGASSCRDVGNTGWQDVSDLAAGGTLRVRIDNYRPFDSKVIVYAGTTEPSTPRMTETSGRGTPTLAVRAFATSAAKEVDALERAASADGVVSLDALKSSRYVSRLEIAINDDGDHKAMSVEFGTAAAAALLRATVDLNNPRRATVCGSTER